MQKINDQVAEAIVEIEEGDNQQRIPRRFRNHILELIKNRGVYIGGVILVSSSFLANIINYGFNSYLGRVLTFEDFALIGLIGSLLSFASILFGAFSTWVNYRSAFLIGKYGMGAGYEFWSYFRKRALLVSVAITTLWIFSIPFLNRFFGTGTPMLYVFFGLILLVGLANSVDRGLVSAQLRFSGLAAINFFDPIIKIITAVVLVSIGLKYWTFTGVPLGIVGTFFVGWYLMATKKTRDNITPVKHNDIYTFQYKFFIASIFTSISSVAFSSLDIILANHYMPAHEAGEYTLLSLVGKMIYFMGGLITPFIIPILSRREGARRDSKKAMYVMVASTALLSGIGYVCFGLFGWFSIPIMYGHKAHSIVDLLPIYTFGMLCYTVSKVFVNYYLVKRVYAFTVATSMLIIAEVVIVAYHHSGDSAIAYSMALIWTLHLALTLSMHILLPYYNKLRAHYAK